MHPFRLLSALALTAVISAVAAIALYPSDYPSLSPESHSDALFASTTTTAPDFGALVASGVSNGLPEEERDLTDEAMTRATSTTTSSTTSTTIPATTTTQSSGGGESSSPSTTQAPPPASDPGINSSAESSFASSINSFRGSNGLGALSRDSGLDSYARAWAKRLAEDGSLSHSNIGSLLPPWSAVGENVGVGPSVASIFNALVDSPGHKANMLGDFTHMGVGVYEDSRGALWTAHVFTR